MGTRFPRAATGSARHRRQSPHSPTVEERRLEEESRHPEPGQPGDACQSVTTVTTMGASRRRGGGEQSPPGATKVRAASGRAVPSSNPSLRVAAASLGDGLAGLGARAGCHRPCGALPCPGQVLQARGQLRAQPQHTEAQKQRFFPCARCGRSRRLATLLQPPHRCLARPGQVCPLPSSQMRDSGLERLAPPGSLSRL